MLPSVAEKEKKDMAERVIKAALLGFGTVGGGVYKVLKMQQEEMVSKLGARVELKKILVRNIEKAAQKTDDPSLLTNNWKEIVAVIPFRSPTACSLLSLTPVRISPG